MLILFQHLIFMGVLQGSRNIIHIIKNEQNYNRMQLQNNDSIKDPKATMKMEKAKQIILL